MRNEVIYGLPLFLFGLAIFACFGWILFVDVLPVVLHILKLFAVGLFTDPWKMFNGALRAGGIIMLIAFFIPPATKRKTK